MDGNGNLFETIDKNLNKLKNHINQLRLIAKLRGTEPEVDYRVDLLIRYGNGDNDALEKLKSLVERAD